MTRLFSILILACLLLVACDKGGAESAVAVDAPSRDGEPVAAAPTTPPTAPPTAPPTSLPGASTSGSPTDSAAAARTAPSGLPDPSELETIEDRIRRAEALIKEVTAAYIEAPAFTDTVNIQATLGGSPAPDEYSIVRMGRGTDIYLKTTANEITCIDGVVLLTMNNVPDRFLKMAMDTDLLVTLRKEFGSYGGVMIQPALRYDKLWPEVVYNLALGMPEEPRISGYRIITDVQGRTLEQISLVSTSGSATINVDPATKFIVSADVDYLPPNSPIPTFRITRHFEFNPQRHDVLPEPITFDPAGRIACRDREELIGGVGAGTIERLAVSQGDLALDFTLHSFLGEEFTLSEQRGSVMVLVFWASWNVESRAGLPKVGEFADWVESSGKPIKIAAINSLPRKNKADQWQSVYDIWEREDLKIIGLMDADKATTDLYQIDGLPLTLVIDPAGRIFRINTKLNADTPRLLQEQCLELLGASG